MNNILLRRRSLIGQLLSFGRVLREEGFKVTTARLYDSIRGLAFIHVADKIQFRSLLRANLVSNQDEFGRFDGIFDEFWARYLELEYGTALETSGEEGKEEQADTLVVPIGPEDVAEGETEMVGASLEKVQIEKDFTELNPKEMERIEALVLRLGRKLGHRLGRRYKATKKVDRVDFRTSFRGALSHGGELIKLRYRKRKPKKNRIYLLLDVSGSMDIYGHFFLVFMYALQKVLADVHPFVFSTDATYIRSYIKTAHYKEALNRIRTLDVNWSGGTDIGTSLMHFYQRHMWSASRSRAVVVIVSDGWDRGNPKVLEDAMNLIHRRCRKLLWLNPLLSSSSYEPICQGMRTALPHVDYFLPFYNVESLAELCRIVEAM